MEQHAKSRSPSLALQFTGDEEMLVMKARSPAGHGMEHVPLFGMPVRSSKCGEHFHHLHETRIRAWSISHVAEKNPTAARQQAASFGKRRNAASGFGHQPVAQVRKHHDIERAGIEIVHMLTETTPLSGIISFQQPAGKTAEERRER